MWRKIKIAKEIQPQDAFVTIGNGQLHFGISACRMMPECLDMQYVEFFRGDEDGLIGVHVTNESSEDSIAIQRPSSKSLKKQNQHVHSFTVVSKNAMERVFGDVGIAEDSVKCKVTVDEDTHNMFVIDMRNPRPAKRKG